jgi:cytochrome bd ubiquinol oxidase subunit II
VAGLAGFRLRALAAGCGAGVIAAAGIAVLHARAPGLPSGLAHRGLPLVGVSAGAGQVALFLLIPSLAWPYVTFQRGSAGG